MRNTVDILNDYQKLTTQQQNDLTYYDIFKSIYCFAPGNVTKVEVVTIADASYNAWLKDDNGYSVEKFSDFLSIHYFEGALTLDEIRNAKSYDIVSDAIDESVSRIKDKEEQTTNDYGM